MYRLGVSKPIGAATMTVRYGTSPMRSTPFLASIKPLQDVRRVASMTACLAEHKGFVNGIYFEGVMSGRQVKKRSVKGHKPLSPECASSAFLAESWTMLNVIKQIEHRGRGLSQF